MKSKYYFPHTATVFFLLTVAVALFSWIGSIYGLGKGISHELSVSKRDLLSHFVWCGIVGYGFRLCIGTFSG